MRAAVLKAFNEPLEIENRPDPDCPEDGVVLKVLACGVCRSDWHGWTGEHPRVKPGSIAGHEFAGEVVAAGPRARYTVGDLLVAPFLLGCGSCDDCMSGAQHTCLDMVYPGIGADGAFAEYVAVPRDFNLAPLPDGMTTVTAAGLGCRVMTSWHALTDRAALQPGEWLAVHGTGGIGLAALLIGRAMGARVVAVDVVPEKLEHALSCGAEAVVDAREGDAARAVHEITGGGAHVSIEAVGIEQTTNASLRSLRSLGRHVQVGLPIGHTAKMQLDVNAIFMRNLAVYGSRGMPPWRYGQLFSLIESGLLDLSPMIGREIRLSDVSAELAAMNGPAPPGVAVVTDFQS